MNLRKRTGEERRRQGLCDKRDNNFAWKNLPPNFTFPKTDLFVEEYKMSMLREFPTKHASKSPVTFVTLKRFAVLLFLPSCWVNSPVPPLPDLPAESVSTALYIAIGRGQRCQMSLGRCCAGSVLLLVQVLLIISQTKENKTPSTLASQAGVLLARHAILLWLATTKQANAERNFVGCVAAG